MLVNYKKIIRRAYNEHWALGAFNTSNLEFTQAIIEAAEEMRSPVIIQTSEKAIDYAGLKSISGLIIAMARKAKVPVILNLDHGRSYRLAVEAARAGYTALMIDGSKLPFVQNITLTRKVVLLGKTYGAGVEGELGTIGGAEDYIKSRGIIMTKPADAKKFVLKTGVDILAVAFGSSHGRPQKGEHLDFIRLRAIRDALKGVPLVFHGASSTRRDYIRKAIRLGVSKINIDTDLRWAFTAAMRKTLADVKIYDPREILGPGRVAAKEVVKEKMTLFGSCGKA